MEALSQLEVIANLYGGDYLAEDRYADWATAERERLRETCLALLTRLAEAYMLLRRYAESGACAGEYWPPIGAARTSGAS